jgi:integrase
VGGPREAPAPATGRNPTAPRDAPSRATSLHAPRRRKASQPRQAKPRERALLAVLAVGGLRIDDALHLRWEDLDGDRLRISAKPELNWTPKSHQEREVYLPEGALRELAAYRSTQTHDRDQDWMFQGRRAGRRLTTNAKIIRDLFEAAGLYQPGKLCHELRRGAASTWLLAGADLNTVRELLGHASVTTTQLYLRTNEDAKRAAASKGLL